MSEFKIEILQDWGAWGLRFGFFQEREGKIYICKPMKMEYIPISADGSFTEASLTLPNPLGQEFCQKMAEALSKRGVKTDNDHKIIGILEATKYHLEDLRQLLKLKELE